MAILSRQMRFTLISGLELGCAAAGFLLGAVMALTDWGYWSLVGATLSTIDDDGAHPGMLLFLGHTLCARQEVQIGQ